MGNHGFLQNTLPFVSILGSSSPASHSQVRSWKRVKYTAGKLVPPKVFVVTPCNCALNCNETIPKGKRERIFKDLKSAVVMTHVEVVATKKTVQKAQCLDAASPEFINCHRLIMLKSQ
jgi:hypothetical protein